MLVYKIMTWSMSVRKLIVNVCYDWFVIKTLNLQVKWSLEIWRLLKLSCALRRSCFQGLFLNRSPHWPYKCGLSRQVVFGDKLNYIEMWDLLPGISGLGKVDRWSLIAVVAQERFHCKCAEWN